METLFMVIYIGNVAFQRQSMDSIKQGGNSVDGHLKSMKAGNTGL